MSHLKINQRGDLVVRSDCARDKKTEVVNERVGVMHHLITHSYSLDSCEGNITQKLRFRLRTTRLGALVVTAGSITTPGRIFLPAAVVHVKQQCYDVNDIYMKKHHYHHKVGAGAHAALVGREALALRSERQGRAPGRSRVLGIWGFLVFSHFPEREGVDTSSAAKSI